GKRAPQGGVGNAAVIPLIEYGVIAYNDESADPMIRDVLVELAHLSIHVSHHHRVEISPGRWRNEKTERRVGVTHDTLVEDHVLDVGERIAPAYDAPRRASLDR